MTFLKASSLPGNLKRRSGDVLFAALVGWSALASLAALWAGRGAHGIPTEAAGNAIPGGIGRLGDFVVSQPATALIPNATDTVLVFSDFQCPFCGHYAAILDSIRQSHPEILVVERHFPIIEIHPAAFNAAQAAECSRRGGDYQRMRMALFENRELVSMERWSSVAALAGIRDSTGLAACVQRRVFAGIVEKDLLDGKKLGIHGTPTIVMHDSVFAGGLSTQELKQRLRSRRGIR